jgi:hypothetical protein
MPFPMSLCCGSQKMRNRHMIGWSLLTIFILLWRHPLGWFVMNVLLTIGGLLEYSDLQQGIVRDIFASRSSKFRPLHEVLNQTLNNKWVTQAIMLSYHFVVLTLPSQYIGVAILMIFVVVIYHKIFSFNKFMRQHSHLGVMYKKDPEKTQKEYDFQIDKKIE